MSATLKDVLDAIAWTDNQYGQMKKIVEALAALARSKGASQEEVDSAAVSAVDYHDTK